jgi:hypothetical protein
MGDNETNRNGGARGFLVRRDKHFEEHASGAVEAAANADGTAKDR